MCLSHASGHLTRNSRDQSNRPCRLLRARAWKRLRNARIGSRQATLLTTVDLSTLRIPDPANVSRDSCHPLLRIVLFVCEMVFNHTRLDGDSLLRQTAAVAFSAVLGSRKSLLQSVLEGLS